MKKITEDAALGSAASKEDSASLALFGYEVVNLSWASQPFFASQEPAEHIVSLSGGVASAVVAELVIQRYGRENVAIWFSDTLYEDEDLYRFIHECMLRWKGKLYWFTDGRNPLEVAAQKKIIPNSRIAPCSYELKVKPFRAFICAMPAFPTVHIGLDRHERKRLTSVPESYRKWNSIVKVEFPLLWCTQAFDLQEIVRSWGIDIPRLYKLGFAHNNCGGRCVRQGRHEWLRLLVHFPDRFAQCSSWEQGQRAQGGARTDRAFLAMTIDRVKIPITLSEMQARFAPLAEELAECSGCEE